MRTMREMAAAIRTPGGFLDDATLPTQRYVTFRAPVLGYSVDDDPEDTRDSMDAMMAARDRRDASAPDPGTQTGCCPGGGNGGGPATLVAVGRVP